MISGNRKWNILSLAAEVNENFLDDCRWELFVSCETILKVWEKKKIFEKLEKPKIKIFLFKHDVTTKPDPQKSIHESNNSISFTTKLPQSLGKLKAGS